MQEKLENKFSNKQWKGKRREKVPLQIIFFDIRSCRVVQGYAIVDHQNNWTPGDGPNNSQANSFPF
jgi:hypothetical protein